MTESRRKWDFPFYSRMFCNFSDSFCNRSNSEAERYWKTVLCCHWGFSRSREAHNAFIFCGSSDFFSFLIFISLTTPGPRWGTQDLRCQVRDPQLRHVGSSSLTRDRTQAPCIGSSESQPLDHQGSPIQWYIFKILLIYLLLPLFTCARSLVLLRLFSSCQEWGLAH